ncbi:MAG: protein kinase [Verrucomicrobiales bacterium]|nr:protein kinase [Verrucomicrobiales bacterium]
MSAENTCSSCGSKLLESASGGVCAACLFQLADSSTCGGAASQFTQFPRIFGLPQTSDQPCPTVGDYDLLNPIGVGGMGIVYRARQRSLGREVALKMIRTGLLATSDELRRFRREARAVAALNHPNIIPIYEVGEFQGLAFFAMQLADGGRLIESLGRPANEGAVQRPSSDAHELERLRRVVATAIKISRAVQHAHERGVLHRDLKPGNILLSQSGEPFVTDFGLAKILGPMGDGQETQAAVGTPAYMAPEQIQGDPEKITTATDTYGLGTILYELLAGSPPFRGQSTAAVLSSILTSEPRRPRAINPLVSLDLESICLKCLQKDARSRYSSARDLADDLTRLQQGLPVVARPIPAVAQMGRWVLRNRSLSLVLAIAAFVFSAWLFREYAAAQSSREASRLLTIRNADESLLMGHAAEAVADLRALLEKDPSDTVARARLSSAILHRRWARHQATLRTGPGGINAIELSLDRQFWAVATAQGTLEFFSRASATAAQVLRVPAELQPLQGLHFLPGSETVVARGAGRGVALLRRNQGSWLNLTLVPTDEPVTATASLSADRILVAEADGTLSCFSKSAELLWTTHATAGGITCLNVSDNGDLVAAGDDGGHLAIVRTRDGTIAAATHIEPSYSLNALQFDGPTSSRLVICPEAPVAIHWTWPATDALTRDLGPLTPVRHLVKTSHGKVFGATADGSVHEFRPQRSNYTFPSLGARPGGPTMSLKLDGDFLSWLNVNGEVHIYDLLAEREVVEPLLLPSRSQAIALDAQAREIATAGADGRLVVWNFSPSDQASSDTEYRIGDRTELNCADVSTDSGWSAVGGEDGSVVLRPPLGRGSRVALNVGGPVQALAFLEGGARLFIGRYDGESRIAPIPYHDGGLMSVGPSNGIVSAVLLPGLHAVAVIQKETRHAEIWDLASNQRLGSCTDKQGHALEIQRLCATPAGGHLLGISDTKAFWWDADAPSHPPEFLPIESNEPADFQLFCCAIDASGRRALLGTVDGIISIWRRGESAPVARHVLPPVNSVAWSPTRPVGYAGLVDGSVFEISETSPPKSIGRINGTLCDLKVSPDDQWICGATTVGDVKIWDTKHLLPASELLRHPMRVNRIVFDGTESQLMSICNDGVVRRFSLDCSEQVLLKWLSGRSLPPRATPKDRETQSSAE